MQRNHIVFESVSTYLGFIKRLLLLVLLAIPSVSAATGEWSVEQFEMSSSILSDNKLGIDPSREVVVWLPPSYHSSNKRYPVVHYLHNTGWSAQQLRDNDKLDEVFKRANLNGKIDEFIFVAGDFRSADGYGFFYANNSIVGRWLDHIVEELVPAIDKRYRTMPNANSRGVSGDFIGGHGALMLAMKHPDVFSSVYALHPVGTDRGDRLMRGVPDWRVLNSAKSIAEVRQAGGANSVFLAMAQAFTPKLDKPPLYAHLMVEVKNRELVVNAENTRVLHKQFLLSHWVPSHASALRSLRGIGFDWGRFDDNLDHVISNQKFTRLLSEYGIEHIAEEYNGNQWSELWHEHGRVENDMLPFFQRFLIFNDSDK